jgi:hypothetical protein
LASCSPRARISSPDSAHARAGWNAHRPATVIARNLTASDSNKRLSRSLSRRCPFTIGRRRFIERHDADAVCRSARGYRCA